MAIAFGAGFGAGVVDLGDLVVVEQLVEIRRAGLVLVSGSGNAIGGLRTSGSPRLWAG
jgi:hypothetical protein